MFPALSRAIIASTGGDQGQDGGGTAHDGHACGAR
jgi:hypothetical protein